MRRLLAVLLAVQCAAGCAARAPVQAPVVMVLDPAVNAWLWTPIHGDEAGAFLLFADVYAADQLADVAPRVRYELRAATADDLRESFPVLSARSALSATGVPEVAFDFSGTGHSALVNFWVELVVAQDAGEGLSQAALSFVDHAL